MHAHIVLNAVNALTGRKAHIDVDGSDRLADIVQKIAASWHGRPPAPLGTAKEDPLGGDR